MTRLNHALTLVLAAIYLFLFAATAVAGRGGEFRAAIPVDCTVTSVGAIHRSPSGTGK